MENNKYSLGFCFSKDKSTVALVHKLKPKWQVGKVNGIGGKKEDNESYHECMVREFKEETGVLVPEWKYVCTIRASWGEMQIFKVFTDDVYNVKTMEIEPIEMVQVDSVFDYNIIPNLNWIIPLCLDKDNIFGILAEENASIEGMLYV